MTPADFLEAVTEAAPRKSAYKKSFSRDEVLKRLRDTTPITPNSDIKNDTEFFRKLGQNGIISFNEYLFLLCIITKPRQGFEVAFKMFDTGKDLSSLWSICQILVDISFVGDHDKKSCKMGIRKLTLKSSKFWKTFFHNLLKILFERFEIEIFINF